MLVYCIALIIVIKNIYPTYVVVVVVVVVGVATRTQRCFYFGVNCYLHIVVYVLLLLVVDPPHRLHAHSGSSSGNSLAS